MDVKAVHVMRLAALILRAMHTMGNAIAKLALVVQLVTHAWRAIMVSRRMDVNVSDFLIVFSAFVMALLMCSD